MTERVLVVAVWLAAAAASVLVAIFTAVGPVVLVLVPGVGVHVSDVAASMSFGLVAAAVSVALKHR